MSTRTSNPAAALGIDLESTDLPRAIALGGVALLTLSYAAVFYHFIDVTGNPLLFLFVGAVSIGAAVYFAHSLRGRTAVGVAAVLLAGGLTLYVLSLPKRPPIVPLFTDAIALTTGRSLLQVANVDLWVLGVSPAPLFLTWYFALRRRYVTAALAGGATLGFLILTDDAIGPVALLGVIGAIVAVGVGDVDRRGDDLAAAEPLAVLLAVMIVLSGFVTVVPGGGAGSVGTWSGFQSGPGGGDAETVEASLVDQDNQLAVQGDISLSPEVRFRVQSSESDYWRIGSYDRYTGDGWVRTGGTRSYDGRLSGPEGQARGVTQEYEVVDDLDVLPAAWRPVAVDDGIADRTAVTDEGGLTIDGSLSEGDTYTVRSRVPAASADDLRDAGTDYPDEIADQYTKIPSSTPDRVAERTERITANADNPYDTARVVERWLRANKNYSLDVERPEENVADAFLFEMDAGYCTYYATTMTVMLRSQGIPARFVSGYSTGERVDRDEWVVRGFNAHAWVEAYFPGAGWVRFDPTPSGPRVAVRQQQLDQARAENRTDVDTNDTGGEEWTPTATATPAPLTPREDSGDPAGTAPEDRGSPTRPGAIPERELSPGIGGVETANLSGSDGAGDDGDGFEMPSREEATLAGIVLVGLVAGVRRLGLFERTYRAIWLRYQPSVDPETDVERAYERLEYLLERRYRPRRPGETHRQYLAAIGADERARTVGLVLERARYAGGVTREEADEAVSLVDELVAS